MRSALLKLPASLCLTKPDTPHNPKVLPCSALTGHMMGHAPVDRPGYQQHVLLRCHSSLNSANCLDAHLNVLSCVFAMQLAMHVSHTNAMTNLRR